MKIKKISPKIIYYLLYLIEIIIVLSLVSLFSSNVYGGAGTNVTVISSLNISTNYPEILNVEINSGSAITLNPNATKTVMCIGLLRDYNNESFIANASAVFFNSTHDSADDNNDHYTNTTCIFTRTFSGTYKTFTDDQYLALINCSFDVLYYANPGNWNCSIYVNNTYGLNDTNSSFQTVNELLALAAPPTINFGTVDATSVSIENFTNLSNAGNVKVNLSLSGYATNPNDGWAMNCSLGSFKNISIMYEKYNLTESTPVINSLSEFEEHYINLTGPVVIKKFDLNPRTEDSYNEATNVTYWRIYVPTGVAGSCQGNIVIGATKSAGT